MIAVPVADRTRDLVAVSAALAAAGIEPSDLAVRRPTLDQVFLHLTGPPDRRTADPNPAPAPAPAVEATR